MSPSIEMKPPEIQSWRSHLVRLAADGDTESIHAFHVGWLESRAQHLAGKVRAELSAQDPRTAVRALLTELAAEYAAEDVVFAEVLKLAVSNRAAGAR